MRERKNETARGVTSVQLEDVGGFPTTTSNGHNASAASRERDRQRRVERTDRRGRHAVDLSVEPRRRLEQRRERAVVVVDVARERRVIVGRVGRVAERRRAVVVVGEVVLDDVARGRDCTRDEEGPRHRRPEAQAALPARLWVEPVREEERPERVVVRLVRQKVAPPLAARAGEAVLPNNRPRAPRPEQLERERRRECVATPSQNTRGRGRV